MCVYICRCVYTYLYVYIYIYICSCGNFPKVPCNPLCGQTGEYQRGCGNDTNSTTKNFIFVLSPLLIILIMLFTNWSPVWLLLTRSLADYPNGHNIRQSLRK